METVFHMDQTTERNLDAWLAREFGPRKSATILARYKAHMVTEFARHPGRSWARLFGTYRTVRLDAPGYSERGHKPTPWTVMLLPPDTIQPHCTDPFMVHVTAVDRSGAFDAAIKAACREYMVGEADRATMEPADWKLLLLCQGHIVNLVDAAG